MPVTDGFLQLVLDQLSSWGRVSARRMFGGAGFYRDGKMFGLIANDIAYLKVDDSNRSEFLEAGSTQFTPYPNKSKAQVMSYYEIPPHILENRDQLARWAERSLTIQGKAKKRPASRR